MSNFATIPGVGVITCEQAVQYRNGRLIAEYDAAFREYDTGRELRIQKVMAEFSVHKRQLIQAWDTTSSINRKKVVANGVGLVLSIGGVATASWMNSRSGLTTIEKAVAGDLVNRGTTFTNTAISGGLTGNIDSVSLALIPVATVAAVIGSPIISVAVTAVGIGIGMLGVGFSIWEYFIDEQDYSQRSGVFINALEDLAERSVNNQLLAIIGIKNQIDAQCGHGLS